MILRSISEQTHAVLILLGAMLTMLQGNTAWLALSGLVTFGWMIISEFSLDPGRRRGFGLPNWITTLRLILIVVAVLLWAEADAYLVLGLLVVSVLLDAVDGYAARKMGTATVFGARYDMETDAYFTTAVAFIIVYRFDMPPLVLFAGLLRYYFILLKRIFHLHNLPTPEMRGVRFLAVVFFISLLAPFVLSQTIATYVVFVGCAAVFYSFGKEFYLLLMMDREK